VTTPADTRQELPTRAAHEALRAVVEGTTAATGHAFFPALVTHLASALRVRHALVGVVDDPPAFTRARTVAVAWDGRLGENFVYDLAGSPCERVLAQGETAYFPDDVADLFPEDRALAAKGIRAYLGTPLCARDGSRLGLLVVLHDRPLDLTLEPRAVLQIFAARAAAELERIRTDEAQRALEEQLQQAHKLDGLGRLAGGVAHDFNNLLTVILSHAQLAEAELPPGSPLRELVAPIREAAERASGLTRQLLAFARKQVVKPRVLDVNEVIADVARLLRRLLGESVAVELRPGEAIWPVRADPGQLEQVLVNLAVNARDAMGGKGVVTIATARTVLGAPEARALGVEPGDWVLLSVQDEGAGMDEPTLRRAFEPFFSTKGERGTGLGLATCHGIVQQAGGRIWAESAVGHGSTFHVLLPHHAAVESLTPGPAPRPAAAPSRRGPATVLVVEDEDAVRWTAVLALRRAGHRVLDAPDGPAALAIARTHEGPIDLLLTDVVMPGMNGREVAEQVRRLRPGVQVLFVSGYAEDDLLRRDAADRGVPVLQKPYTPDELGVWVSELLDASPSGAMIG
jgi:signal transduction histidine kinase